MLISSTKRKKPSRCLHAVSTIINKPHCLDSQYVFQMRKMTHGWTFPGHQFAYDDVILLHDPYFCKPELLTVDKRFITGIQSLSGHWTPHKQFFKHGFTHYWLTKYTVWVFLGGVGGFELIYDRNVPVRAATEDYSHHWWLFFKYSLLIIPVSNSDVIKLLVCLFWIQQGNKPEYIGSN